jgi:hypothetical protein
MAVPEHATPSAYRPRPVRRRAGPLAQTSLARQTGAFGVLLASRRRARRGKPAQVRSSTVPLRRHPLAIAADPMCDSRETRLIPSITIRGRSLR